MHPYNRQVVSKVLNLGGHLVFQISEKLKKKRRTSDQKKKILFLYSLSELKNKSFPHATLVIVLISTLGQQYSAYFLHVKLVLLHYYNAAVSAQRPSALERV